MRTHDRPAKKTSTIITVIIFLWNILDRASVVLGIPDMERQMKEWREDFGITSEWWLSVVLLVICSTILVYLWWPNIRRRFGRPQFLSARDAAEYVMKHLEKDINQATDFVTQMAKEERIHIRAVENGHSTASPVAPEIFQEHVLHLIGDENERRQAEYLGCAFHAEGWIVKQITRELDDALLYQAPRFRFEEIEEVVNEYR